MCARAGACRMSMCECESVLESVCVCVCARAGACVMSE